MYKLKSSWDVVEPSGTPLKVSNFWPPTLNWVSVRRSSRHQLFRKAIAPQLPHELVPVQGVKGLPQIEEDEVPVDSVVDGDVLTSASLVVLLGRSDEVHEVNEIVCERLARPEASLAKV